MHTLIVTCIDTPLLQMLRPVLLLAAVAILACCDTPPPQLDRCATIRCAGVNEEDCPGEYLPYNPPERCCSQCTIYKGVVHQMDMYCLSHMYPSEQLVMSR
jgi:hypothetical protein